MQRADNDVNHSIRKSILRIAGFVLSVLFISAGVFLMRQGNLLAGLIILVLSLALLFFSARSIEKNPIEADEFSSLKPYLLPAVLFFAALVFTGFAIFNISVNPRTASLNHWAAAEWLLSLLCLAAGILLIAHWKPLSPGAAWEWIKANRLEFILVTLVVIAGLVIRMVLLMEHPYPWSGDEASVGMEARRILVGENTDLFNTGWSGQPNVSFLPTLFSMLLFGNNFLAIKMTSVLVGTFSILALYLLAREWFSWGVAIIAAGFMAALPFHLQFSRIGVDNIVDSLMAPLVLWLIFRAIRKKTLPAYLLAGIVSGFTIYTYVGTRLVLVMGVGAIIYVIIKQRGYIKSSLQYLAACLAGLLVTVAPMAAFFIKHPDLFMTRIGQEGIFLNGWLPRQVELTGQSIWQIFLHQFTQTVLVFFAQNAYGGMLNFDRPYLTILGSIFFFIGMAVAFRYLLEPRYFILQAWFWSVLTFGGFLTLNPPASTRLVMTIPAVSLFIALGAWQVARILLQLKFNTRYVYALCAALVIILAFQNLEFYFGEYRTQAFGQDANGELGMETGLELQRLGSNYDFYLFGEPRVFAGFPTTDFLAPEVEKFDLQAESIPGLSLPPGRGALIAAIPENEALLQQVVERFPGGAWEAVPRKVKDEVLYYAYILTPDQLALP